MDWNRFTLLAFQSVVFAGLVALVALGHDSGIETAMLVIAGSITGVNVVDTARQIGKTKSAE